NELFHYRQMDTGADSSVNNRMTAKLTLNAMIIEGALQIDIEYHSRALKPSRLQALSQELQKQLMQLVDHLQDIAEEQWSPSDFDAVQLDQSDLERLFS
ncbi:MAG: hypothetical protein AAFP19_27105, partial [Bacteroidota bacterium]